MVPAVRLERTTFRLWAGCNIHFCFAGELSKIMAGALGFEPRLTVLETARIASYLMPLKTKPAPERGVC